MPLLTLKERQALHGHQAVTVTRRNEQRIIDAYADLESYWRERCSQVEAQLIRLLRERAAR